jgi:hypothetical protein
MVEIIECPYCGADVEVIAVESAEATIAQIFYGIEPGAWVREARELRFSPTLAALHHVCSHPQVGDSDWWRFGSWWACKEPMKGLDEDVKYDLNCADCARRYISDRTN